MGVSTPRPGGHVHCMPHPPRPARPGALRPVPRQCRRQLGVQPSGSAGDVHPMPRTPPRTQRRRMRELPRRGQELGVPAPVLVELLQVSQGSGEPLRDRVFVMPLGQPRVVQRNVQPPQNPGRRAFLSELRVRQLPSGRVLLGNVCEVSRHGERTDRRLDPAITQRAQQPAVTVPRRPRPCTPANRMCCKRKAARWGGLLAMPGVRGRTPTYRHRVGRAAAGRCGRAASSRCLHARRCGSARRTGPGW